MRSLAGSGLGKASASCRTATELVSASFDRKLGIRERIRLRLHLLACRACRNYLSNLRMMGDALEEPYLADDPDEGLSDEALARIRERLKK
ncbi:MAG: zf-HC2 domain-containing protein [Acidobacteriota bacterium]|nr:MAG: zf-HC2 domain-containing protein [Acidobacteriota bacterium]